MSIRLRLMLWYGTLFAVILLFVGLFSYAFHTRGHYDDFDRALITSAGHAAAEAGAGAGAPHLVEGSGGLDVVLRLYNGNGVLEEATTSAIALPLVDPASLLRSPAPPAFDPVAGLAPPMLSTSPIPSKGAFGLLTAGGQRWRTYIQPLYERGTLVGYIEAAMPLGRLDDSVRVFRLVLLVIGMVGLITAVGGSGMLAGRALRPITQMVGAAQSITRSRDFSRRIDVPPQQDELGRLATTLNTMLANLEDAYRAQQRFVADASHELRAPLTAILGNLELICRQHSMPESERDEALAEARREAERLSRLVADLLALARADAGISIKQQPVELDSVVLDAFRTAQQLAKGQRLALEPFEPIRVIGDADRLQQLILILLDNALKYTPADGAIAVGLRCSNQHAEIIVRDTGVGIAETDLARVFERFYRADPARGRDPGGTGLGLPIARWIAEEHGGTINLASELGHGTIVVVRLPVLS